MDAFDAIKKRVSCRDFQEKAVPKELLEKIVDAGRRAPSANNVQPVQFIVVIDKHNLIDIAKLTDHGHFIAQAPACIVVFSETTKYFLEDGAAAVENMLIAVAALGLGACWVAGDKKSYSDQVRKKLNVPEDFKLIALVPLGYPANDREPREKRPLSEVIHWEDYRD